MPEQPMLKRCSVRKDWLPLNLFYKNKTRKDGLTQRLNSPAAFLLPSGAVIGYKQE